MMSSISKARPKATFPDYRPVSYYITDRQQSGATSLLRCIRRALDWGVDFIQIREKDLPDRDLYDLACRVTAIARGTRSRVLVNSRADIAMAAGADGVHLASSGLQIAAIRSWIPRNFIVGVSVHTLQEIRNASFCGADYILVGHVFPTASKAGMGSNLGLDFLRKACASTSVPILALGGMNAEAIAPVLQTGAAGVAGISLFQKNTEFSRMKKAWPARAQGLRNPL